MKYLTILVVALVTITTSCKKGCRVRTVTGTVKAQGMTTYQYGTHVLKNDAGKTQYALRSGSVNLNDYINQKVEIKGTEIKGYPVDGGPEYIEVSAVK